MFPKCQLNQINKFNCIQNAFTATESSLNLGNFPSEVSPVDPQLAMHMTSHGLLIQPAWQLNESMASRSGKGKTCAAGAPGKISCTNNSYTPGISMHVFPRDKKVWDQWVKFVRVHRPDWQPSEFSALCSLHFEETCYTRLKLSSLMPSDGGESS